MASLLVKNAKIFVNGEFVLGNILIEDRKIAAIGKKEFKADYAIDANEQPVVPGGIDIHAHVYDPEMPEHEDWRSGSLAGAFGGLTTLVDMPLRTPVDNVKVFEAKIEEAKKNSYLNYGIIGGFVRGSNIQSIPTLSRRGVRAFKFFTCRPFKIEEEAIGAALEAISNINGVAIFHAEDDGLIAYWEGKLRGQKSILAYHLSRTPSVEAAAILRVGFYAIDTLSRVHIAHLSSKAGLEAIKYLRGLGAKITAEVTPHHLYFTREDSVKYGNLLKLAPTLKTAEDRDALWRGLESGSIEIYASDNAPSPRSLKDVDVWEAWGGIPNLEIMGPFLFTYGVLQRRLSFRRFVEVFSANPARLLDIYPAKGAIAVGSYADLYVMETRKAKKISASTHHHKVDWTPWEGMEFYGTPLHLIVNGEVVIEEGELVGKPGIGIYIGDLVKERRGE